MLDGGWRWERKKGQQRQRLPSDIIYDANYQLTHSICQEEVLVTRADADMLSGYQTLSRGLTGHIESEHRTTGQDASLFCCSDCGSIPGNKTYE